MQSTPISLYLELEPNAIADLETVARASLAFSDAVKELAFLIDPSLKIGIGLESGTEGSLTLNSWIKGLKSKSGQTITLSAIALVVLTWFSNHALDWTFEQFANHVVGERIHKEEFSPEQKTELHKIVADALAAQLAKEKVQRIYREIEKDPSVTGLGATQHRGHKPSTIVPRALFSERGGYQVSDEQGVLRRSKVERTRLIVISPVLLEGTRRRWKFKSADREFGATVLDEGFLRDVYLGKVSIPMAGGVELDVDLQTSEERSRGAWEPYEWRILHVYRHFRLPQQGELVMSPPKPDDASNHADEN